MGLFTLYNEELRAVVRGRFAWLGAGVVLLSVGALAAISTQDTWLDGYRVIAYFLAPLAFIPHEGSRDLDPALHAGAIGPDQPQGPFSRRADARPRPACQTRDLAASAGPFVTRERHDVF
jgi:hypothetical protein